MADGKMLFIMRTETGEEFGPVPQDTLIEWGKNGRVSAKCSIRNSLMKSWKPAKEVSFLKDIIDEYEAIPRDKSITTKLKRMIDHEKPAETIQKNLHSSADSIKPASFGYRSAAFVIDAVILLICLLTVAYMLKSTAASGSIDLNMAVMAFIAAAVVIPFVYWVFTLGLRAQTFGQTVFGIMLVKGEGNPVYLGRAYIFTLIFILTMPLEPLFVYVLKCGLHERLTGTRIVNVKLG